MKLIEDMVQGSEEWLAFRKNYITASEAPIIMGVSPWQTPFSLWQYKMGLTSGQKVNSSMKRGNEMEEPARCEFIKLIGIEVKPAVALSDNHKFMMASFDGISQDGNIVVEIKCPGRTDHDKALSGVVPDKYFPQLQHQMSVAGVEVMFYFSFDGSKGKAIKVNRDDGYILKMIEKEKEFYQMMEDLQHPPLQDMDYEQKSTLEWHNHSKEWLAAKDQIKKLEAIEEYHRKKLIDLSEGRNSIGAGIKLSRHIRKGTIEYKEIPEIGNINMEKYRKIPVEYWKLAAG